MAFKDFLFSFFPHRWLNPKAPGVIRLLGGIGATLDEIFDLAKQVQNEMRIATAVATIPDRETEFGIPVDPIIPIEIRRASLIAREREKGGSITSLDIIAALGVYGVNVTIQNNPNIYEMLIRMDPESVDVPGFTQMNVYLERARRAHVGKVWAFPAVLLNPKDLQATDTHNVNVSPYNRQVFKLDGEWLLNGQIRLNNQPGNTDNNASQGLKTSSHHSFSLDGNWFLDGNEYLNSDPLRENISSVLTVEKDLWHLDGTYYLDGEKILDAEIILYEL